MHASQIDKDHRLRARRLLRRRARRKYGRGQRDTTLARLRFEGAVDQLARGFALLDGDGVLEGDEINGWLVEVIPADFLPEHTRSWWAYSNPFSNDTDNDGASDGDEYRWRSDPTLTDTDGDWLPDGYELEHNGSMTTPESDPPEVFVDKSGVDLDLNIVCIERGWLNICTKYALERQFSLKLKFTDAAGIASAKVWLIEGEEDIEAGIVAPERAIDTVALAAHVYGDPSDGGISAASNGMYPVASMDGPTAKALRKDLVKTTERGTYIRAENGLRSEVVWQGTISERVPISTANAISGDLWDLFGAYTLAIVAEDVNGNTGVGQADFGSIADIIADVAGDIWASIVNLANAARDAISELMEMAIEFVKKLAKELLNKLIKPMFEKLNALGLKYVDEIEYLSIIVDAVFNFEYGPFIEHEWTQALFSAVFELIGGFNGNSFSITTNGEESWFATTIQSVLNTFSSFMEKVQQSVQDAISSLENLFPGMFRWGKSFIEIIELILDGILSIPLGFDAFIRALDWLMEYVILFGAIISIVTALMVGFSKGLLQKAVGGILSVVTSTLVSNAGLIAGVTAFATMAAIMLNAIHAGGVRAIATGIGLTMGACFVGCNIALIASKLAAEDRQSSLAYFIGMAIASLPAAYFAVEYSRETDAPVKSVIPGVIIGTAGVILAIVDLIVELSGFRKGEYSPLLIVLFGVVLEGIGLFVESTALQVLGYTLTIAGFINTLIPIPLPKNNEMPEPHEIILASLGLAVGTVSIMEN